MNAMTTLLRVKDLMTHDMVTVCPDAPIVEIARLLITHRIGGVPVVDENGHVVGMVTTSDLFLKEEPLPRTHHTFPGLFKAPMLPFYLTEGYVMRGPGYVAADIMTCKVVCVTETDSIGKAVQLMARFGIKRLPVLTAAREAEGKLVGILTRSDIIRLLAGQTKEPAMCMSV